VILAVSQFRVINGLEAAVRQAFQDRPHLVDLAPGFLDMEVLVNTDDQSIFSLVTRWADLESFRAWKSSEAHKLSHSGIPKGLRLDPAYTKLTLLHEVTEDPDDAARETLGREWVGLLTGYLWSSAAVHLLVADIDGALKACNTGIAQLLDVPAKQLRGQTLWPYLTEPDEARLREFVVGGPRVEPESMLLNFVSADRMAHTLECTVSVRAGAFAVVGNIPSRQDRLLQKQLIDINNELSVLAHERANRNKELTATRLALENTLQELNTLYWRIRKIREVLPMCLKCGKVQSGETRWEDVADFMIDRFPFLSHGYCPDCASRQIAEGDEARPPR
jgi:heme-degrading monooxygenase HmoA